MKAFYRLIQGDCSDVLPILELNSVDCIITDPPYGINFDTNHRLEKPKNIGSFAMDNFRIFHYLPKIVGELKRVIKFNSAFYSFCRWDTIHRFKPIIERGFTIKNLLIWVKNNWSMGDLKKAYASQYECCLYATHGKPILRGRRDTDILFFDRKSNSKLLHSAEKPEKLIAYLMKKSSDEGDVILDLFLGSGTTMKVAQDLGRSCIGIEINPDYCEIVKKRCFGRKFLDHEVEYQFEKRG